VSTDATTWAKAQKCPSARAKAVLICLAPYADAEGMAWAAIDVLVIETELKIARTVQRGLADLKAAGLIEETGETKVFKGRIYPIYRLPLERGPANTRERLAMDRAELGVTPVSPHGAWGDTTVTPRGDTGDALGVTPMSPKENQQNLQPNSQGASAGEPEWRAGFEALKAAVPALMVANSNLDQALQAYIELAQGGQPVEKLALYAARMAVHPTTLKRDFAPVGLEKWLRWGRWEGWTDEALAKSGQGSAAGSAAGSTRTPFADPHIRAALVAMSSGASVASYLDPCGWDPAGRTITPRTTMARKWLAEKLRHWAGPSEAPLLAAPAQAGAVNRSVEGVS
jgi:hypothetical protein